MKWINFFFAMCIILAVVWVIPAGINYGVSYWLDLCAILGKEPVPLLTDYVSNVGDADGFLDGLLTFFDNVIGIGGYAIQWIKYWAQQLMTIVLWISGGVRPV